jgi:hypothetical protein
MPPTTPNSADRTISRVVNRQFHPIFGISVREIRADPSGTNFLPWLRRVRKEQMKLILEWNNSTCELQVWHWYVFPQIYCLSFTKYLTPIGLWLMDSEYHLQSSMLFAERMNSEALVAFVQCRALIAAP